MTAARGDNVVCLRRLEGLGGSRGCGASDSQKEKLDSSSDHLGN